MGTVKGYRVLATPQDVAQFFFYLVFERKCNVNPDDNFADYVDENGNKSFNDEEVECYERMMETSFDICETYHVDIYEICMRILALFHFCDGNEKMRIWYDNL